MVVLQKGVLQLSERYASFHMDRQVRRIVFGNSRKPRQVNGAVGAAEWISEIRLRLCPNRNDRTLFRRERLRKFFYGFRPEDRGRREIVNDRVRVQDWLQVRPNTARNT